MSVADFPFISRVYVTLSDDTFKRMLTDGKLLRDALTYKASEEELRHLIRLGCDVNHPRSSDRSPIYSAMTAQNTSGFRLLVEAGATIGEREITYAWRWRWIPILEYLLVEHCIPLRKRGDIPGAIEVDLAELLMKVRTRVARCQRAVFTWLVWVRCNARMRTLVAKDVAQRIARALWETRRQPVWNH